MSTRERALHAPSAAMIAVADAGYALHVDDETWLRGVLEAARPLLDHGSFVHGWVLDLKALEYRSCAAVQLPESADLERDVRHNHLDLKDVDASIAFAAAGLGTASMAHALRGPELERRGQFPAGFGVADCVALSVADPSGIGCVLVGALPHVARVTQRDQARWSRVGSHLAAALRLRERMRALPAEARLDAADALLDPRTNALAHLGSDAAGHQAAIRSAADLLAARHRAPDPAKLVAAWRALVAGRWSLVDSFDTDGKRFFVLRKNEPTAPGPSLLAPVQRAIAAYVAMGHSNKAIAYHLGLSESTVSRAVVDICWKVGVASREQLAQLAGALGAHPGGADA